MLTPNAYETKGPPCAIGHQSHSLTYARLSSSIFLRGHPRISFSP